MNLKEKWKIEKEKLSHMSFKEKIGYIWEYYKLHMFIGLIILFFLGAIGTGIYNSTFDTRLYCMVLNSPRSQQNFQVITEDFAHAMGYDGKKDQIFVESMIGGFGDEKETAASTDPAATLDPNNLSDPMGDYTTVMKMTALISAKELDVVICDQEAFEYYGKKMGAFYDLSSLLPGELAAQAEGHTVSLTVEETGQTITAGIDITETWFAEAVDLTMEPAYLCVVSNSQRTDAALDLIRYIYSR